MSSGNAINMQINSLFRINYLQLPLCIKKRKGDKMPFVFYVSNSMDKKGNHLLQSSIKCVLIYFFQSTFSLQRGLNTVRLFFTFISFVHAPFRNLYQIFYNTLFNTIFKDWNVRSFSERAIQILIRIVQ